MMKVMYLLFFVCCATYCTAQSTIAEVRFHEGSNQFINGNPQQALATVNEGLRSDPGNAKLSALKKILEEEQKKQEQQKKEQEKKDREKKEQEKKEQQQKDKEQKEKDQKEKEQKEKEQQEKEDKDKQDENKEENKDDKDQKEKEDQAKEEQKQKEQEEKDKEEKEKQNKELPPDVKKRLEDMQISEEKARMILEALKNQEVQYLQQRKREGQKRNNNKPDW